MASNSEKDSQSGQDTRSDRGGEASPSHSDEDKKKRMEELQKASLDHYCLIIDVYRTIIWLIPLLGTALVNVHLPRLTKAGFSEQAASLEEDDACALAETSKAQREGEEERCNIHFEDSAKHEAPEAAVPSGAAWGNWPGLLGTEGRKSARKKR